MLTRRQFLTRTLKSSSLFALGTVVPQFVFNTAHAAEAGKDTTLLVIEMTGGNDGLNMVIPYADDLYYKARPKIGIQKAQAVKFTDELGLNPGMRSFDQLIQKGQLAVVQGVGYPNPDRSHFESMDIWQSADPKRQTPNGWLARSVSDLQDKRGSIPVMQVGPEKLPLALTGAPSGVVSLNNLQPFRLNLGPGDADQHKARKQLMMDLAKEEPADKEGLFQFVQRRQLQTHTNLELLQDVLKTVRPEGRFTGTPLGQKFEIIYRLIEKGFGTRVFYVAIDGFDTHSGQLQPHQQLLQDISDCVTFLFQNLAAGGHDKRLMVMTYSEFGRRVYENGSAGTDHGSGSCLFVAGPGVKGGPVGKHPSLSDLDTGDLKFHTDFRRVYATILDGWLGVDSKAVLGEKYEHLDFLKAKG